MAISPYFDALLNSVRNAVPREWQSKTDVFSGLRDVLVGELEPPAPIDHHFYKMPMQIRRRFNAKWFFKNFIINVYRAEVNLDQGCLATYVWNALFKFYDDNEAAGNFEKVDSTACIGFEMLLNMSKIHIQILRDREYPGEPLWYGYSRAISAIINRLDTKRPVFVDYPDLRSQRIKEFAKQSEVLKAIDNINYLITGHRFEIGQYIRVIDKARIISGVNFGGSAVGGMVLRSGIFLNLQRFDGYGFLKAAAADLVIGCHELTHHCIRETADNFNLESPTAFMRPGKQTEGTGIDQPIESGREIELELCRTQIEWNASSEEVGRRFVERAMRNQIPVIRPEEFRPGEIQDYQAVPFFGCHLDPNLDRH